MSITVCGEDFSSNLAHKDLLEISYLRVPDDYFCWDTGLFHIYCVRGELRLSSTRPSAQPTARCRNPPVSTRQKLFSLSSYATDKHRYYCFGLLR